MKWSDRFDDMLDSTTGLTVIGVFLGSLLYIGWRLFRG